jgi:hypothetical protein
VFHDYMVMTLPLAKIRQAASPKPTAQRKYPRRDIWTSRAIRIQYDEISCPRPILRTTVSNPLPIGGEGQSGFHT